VQPDRPEPALTTPMVLSFYAGMLFVALVLLAFTEPGPMLLLRHPAALPVPWWAAGVGVGVALVLGSALAERLWPPMRRLAALLSETLGPVGSLQAGLWALASGVAEEALFRGFAQHAVGYVAASLVFALLHGGISRKMIAWSTFALVAGLSFGLLAEAYASIWPAAVAHVVVNAVNLRRLGRLAMEERP
jgi:membrane protease YdiL (CAAX protease family)